MTWLKRITLVFGVGLVAPHLWAADLAGIWQSEDQPAWIEVAFADGSGTGIVRRNDNKPEAVGREFLQGITLSEDTGSWQAQIYAERFKEYKDAVITLPEPDRMKIVVKVGFMSKTVYWTRVASLPASEAVQ